MSNQLTDIYEASRETLYNLLAVEIRNHPEKTYPVIAHEQRTNIAMVVRVAKMFGLTRPRGRRASTSPVVQKEGLTRDIS